MRPTARHLIKMAKLKDKESILKAARVKKQVTQGKPHKDISCVFSSNSTGQKEVTGNKVLEERNYNLEYYIRQSYHSELKKR